MTDIAGARVLIVDDDATSRRLLEVRLRATECEVVMAANGQEALSSIQQEVPALMLLDLQMPRMGGMELLRALRRDGIDLQGGQVMKRTVGIFALAAVTVLVLVESALGTYGGGKTPILAKMYWPEKEEVTHHRVEYGEMRDSCIPTHPFDLLTRSPRPC